MKKVLRFIGILLLILVAGFLILCLTGDKVVEIERSTNINSPKAVVWNQMVKFDNWKNWSPWKKMDSTMTYTVDGQDGQVGAVYTWKGDPKKSGTGTITGTEIGDGVFRYDMHFIDYDAHSQGYLKIEDADEGVKAIWGYRAEQPFFMRGMGALMGMKSMLEENFDDGLSMLKEYCESGKAGMGYDIREITFPATSYATKREIVKWADLEGFFGPAYGAVGGAAGDMIVGNAQAIYYTWDEENQQTEVAAAFPVSGPVKGMEMVDVPESSCLTIRYQGGYSQSYGMHMALGAKAGEAGKEVAYVIEEYEVGPPKEADSNNYVTSIYYILK